MLQWISTKIIDDIIQRPIHDKIDSFNQAVNKIIKPLDDMSIIQLAMKKDTPSLSGFYIWRKLSHSIIQK